MFGKKNKDGGNNPSGNSPSGSNPREPRPGGPRIGGAGPTVSNPTGSEPDTWRDEARPLRRTAGELPLTPPNRQEAVSPAGRYDTGAPRAAEPSPPPTAAAPSPSNLVGARNSAESEGKRLSVGKGISLTGEIRNCESLFVEGEVEVKLQDCRWLQIAEGGLVKGSATVENAEISGRFVGDLTVRGCLTIKRGGLVEGDMKYAELEVERGGRLVGQSAKNDLEA